MAEVRRDPVATVVGLLTFLGGVALIVTTFTLARGMFSVSPEDAMGIKPGQTLDINRVMAAALGVLMRVVLLIVMAGIGSIVASRGIKLYVHGGGQPPAPKKGAPKTEEVKDS